MGMKERIVAVTGNALGKRIVGSVIMVSKGGETVYARAAGLADREKNIPVEMDTQFRFASFTKPMVAATILAMGDKGLISVEDRVTKFLPWFTPKPPDGTAPEIRIRDLLTHTAGLGGDFSLSDGEASNPRIRDVYGNIWLLTLEENIRRLAGWPLRFAPGTGWFYSLSIDVLGLIAANINNSTLQDAVAKYVFAPLGMKDTTFALESYDGLATAYADAEGGGAPVAMDEPHAVRHPRDGKMVVLHPARAFEPRAFHSGGGGTIGTAPDFLKFLNALRGGGAPILKPETLQAAIRNQIGAIPRDAYDAGRRFGFLGAVIDDPVAARTPQNKGTYTWGGVFGSSWFVDPVADVAVAILTNTALEGVNGPYPNHIRDAVYGQGGSPPSPHPNLC